MGKKKKNSKLSGFILFLAVMTSVVIGGIAIVNSFKMAQKAAMISDKILYYYTKSDK